MLAWLRRILFGSPLPSWRAIHERLPKFLALPIFASDSLSSVAYATEEILLILVTAGLAMVGHPYVFQISASIAILLWIVVISYRQTVVAYPSGGGAYIVAKDNLGDKAGLAAGSALTIDYILTVAVSISAGVAAIVSLYPILQDHRVLLALAGIGLITLINLRGVRESGLIFAFPTYLFIFSMFAFIAFGLFRLFTAGLSVPIPPEGTYPEQTFEIKNMWWLVFLLLRGFSGGCAAMTGTEAISNAVQAFRPPESKNAATTLVIQATILSILFLGISYLAYRSGAVPMELDVEGYETLVSQVARSTFSDTQIPWFHDVVQWATALILFLAANTSFAGFPRLASIMARDRFFPRQFYNLGDRLVFSNGILVLAIVASILVVAFRADTNALIPLYAVGVFLSFTLSQSGMVVRFRRLKPEGWRAKSAMSTFGAIMTGIVTVVLAVTKFTGGAGVVVVLIPALMYLFWKVHQHYVELGNQLRLTADDKFQPLKSTVLVLTPSLHRGMLPALEYAKGLCGDIRAVHIETDPLDTVLLEERWGRWGGDIPLVILESPYRSLIGPLLDYLEQVKKERDDDMITVVIPEFVPARWWHKILHNQSGFWLKFALLFRKDIVVANVRYYIKK